MSSATELVHRAVELGLRPLVAEPGQRVGVACSGGLDSLVLAQAAGEVLGPPAVVLLHIDHGLGAGSAAVARELGQWAAARGLGWAARRVEVPRRGSLEASARQVRYRALAALAEELALGAVATAHTARDQAETVLLRLLRGTGVAGLAAIAQRRGKVVRPLLALEREVVVEYARARALAPWQDPMNADLRFARVRVRERLVPLLRAENPSVEAALLRLAAQAAEWTAALDELAAPLAARLVVSELAAQPAAVRKRALALALAHRQLGYDAAHVEALDELVRRPAAGSVELSLPGARAVREYDRLSIHVSSAAAMSLGADPVGEPAAPAPAIPASLEDPARFAVRTPLPGDRMRPARLRGRSRKLSDLFVDAKVARRLRAVAWVVCRRDTGEIVWVEHLGWAHGADAESEPG